MSKYQDQNRAAWDKLVDQQSRFCRVATDEECAQPLKTLDTRGWLPGSVRGLRVLCLAAGGGWQSTLYAVAGAEVTVVDISPGMLELDQREARKRNLQVKLCEGSMDDLSFLAENSFDIVHHPVSSCYVPDITKVYTEVSRIIKDGGLYISQHKQPTSLQIVDRDQEHRYVLGIEYYHRGPLPEVPDKSYREPNAKEYLHRWEDLVGGLARSGFVIEDLREPYRGKAGAMPGEFQHRGRYTPPYVRILARRKMRSEHASQPAASGNLWLP